MGGAEAPEVQPQASERVRAKAMMETVRDDARVYDADGGISGGERSARSDPFANLGMTSARRDASSLAPWLYTRRLQK